MADYQFDREEFVTACAGLSRKHFARTTVLLGLGLGLIAASRIHRSGDVLVPLVFFGGIFALVVLFWVYLGRRRMGKLFDDVASMSEAINARFDDDGVHLKYDTGSHSLLWKRVKKWGENDRFVYLYESDIHARIIPKRALSTEEDTMIRVKLADTRRA